MMLEKWRYRDGSYDPAPAFTSRAERARRLTRVAAIDITDAGSYHPRAHIPSVFLAVYTKNR